MPIVPSPRVLVTGAGSGLGRAFCQRLAARGARILAADIDLESARATCALLPGTEIHAARADVAERADVEALADEAERRFGGIDLVINNAGVAVGGNLGEVPLEDWRWILGVNLWGVIHGCEVFVPRLRRQGAGHVLNVASAAGLLSTPRLGPYNTTKAAVVALSETLHAELLGSGVGCTVLCPTFFPTNIGKSSRNSGERERKTIEKLMARSKLDAGGVADVALEACARDQLYALPHADGRWMWRMKRAMPESFGRLFPRLIARASKRMSPKAPPPSG